MFVARDLDVLDQAALQELVRRQDRFPNEAVIAERFAEHARGVLGEFLGRGPAAIAQRRGRADRDQLPRWRFHPLLHPPDEAGQVGALRAIEGVQLIHYQVTQRFRFILLPERQVGGAHQQVVEHLVVGEQDVRRRCPHRVPVRDHLVLGHHGGGFQFLPAQVEPRGHVAAQFGIAVDRLGEALGLVRGQGVHREDDDGLDALSPAVPEAVVEDWV